MVFGMEHITFVKLAKKIIEEEKRPLSSEEIWDIAKQKSYDTRYISTQGKTPWRTIGARIYRDMRKLGDNSEFIKAGSYPRRFYLKYLPKYEGRVEIKESKYRYEEKLLHPFLVYFADNYFNAYVKTIDHTRSSKNKYGDWLHPDLVGCNFAPLEWEPEVSSISKFMANASIKIYSFELKVELSLSNLRESFFQTVSNSSWANEGYLAAGIINEEDEDLLYELKRLSQFFGIGIIKIDTFDPDSSKVLFPVKYKEYLDWETINKLAEMNPDFKAFLDRISKDIQIGEVRDEHYDRIHEAQELINDFKNANKKKISVSDN